MPSTIHLALIAYPRTVIWAYLVFAAILTIGLATIFLRGEWQSARGFDKLILFGPLFYAAPVAAFGTEHFTLAGTISTFIPAWIPWHYFWTYAIGAGFIVGGLSLVTKVQFRLAAALFAFTFFVFVVVMDIPGWLQTPRDRFAAALTLRELAFCGGPLALFASLSHSRERSEHILATIARYFIAVPVLFYSYEQFRHADHVPGVPLEAVMPAYIHGHSFWTYLCAVGYAITGILLFFGKKTRAAAVWLGLTVLLVELAVYVPIGVVERASLDQGFNFMADTLMFCGTVLLLATAMPRET